MALINKKRRSVHFLLAVVLCCSLTACSAGNNASVPDNQIGDVITSESQKSEVAQVEAITTEETDATIETTDSATITTNETSAASSAATDETVATADPIASAGTAANTETAEASAATEATEASATIVRETTGSSQVEAALKTNDKLIGNDSGYSFYLDANNSVYSIDSAGKRTDCTMLSEYSGWATFFTFNSDLYIFNENTKARKACVIPSGDIFLGEKDFHVYYISADYSKAYSINESVNKHESAILLYGGNYYFALDSSIYTVMPNGSDLKQLYSEHSEVGPHNEHILELARIENGIIYYTDESTGDVLKCQYDLAEGKAYYIDPETGKADPR